MADGNETITVCSWTMGGPRRDISMLEQLRPAHWQKRVARALCIGDRAFIVKLSNQHWKRFDFAVQTYGSATVMNDIDQTFRRACSTPRPNGEYWEEHLTLYWAVVAVALCSAGWALQSQYNVINENARRRRQ